MRRILALISVLALTIGQQAIARPHRAVASDSTDNCYDSSDPTQIRLWNGDAPGATGSDVCQDVPYLQVYPAANGNQAAPAMLLIAGGGYAHLTNTKEQQPVATYFSQQLNITTFVLYYRLVQDDGTYRYPVPMWDGQRALKLIRSKARALHVDPGRIGLFGFSAGGHLATTLALHPDTDFGLPVHDTVDGSSGMVNTLGLGYPVISMYPNNPDDNLPHPASRARLLRNYTGTELSNLEKFLSAQDNVGPNTPPVFLFVSRDDATVPVQQSLSFIDALNKASIPDSTHVFDQGQHGVGLATDQAQENVWPELFRQWLTNQHFIR